MIPPGSSLQLYPPIIKKYFDFIPAAAGGRDDRNESRSPQHRRSAVKKPAVGFQAWWAASSSTLADQRRLTCRCPTSHGLIKPRIQGRGRQPCSSGCAGWALRSSPSARPPARRQSLDGTRRPQAAVAFAFVAKDPVPNIATVLAGRLLDSSGPEITGIPGTHSLG